MIWGEGHCVDIADRDHDVSMRQFLQRCMDKGICLNKERFEYKCKNVRYIGHQVTQDGLQPDPAKIEAMVNMPPPEDRQGVQRLMGMINYLQKFAPHLSDLTAPIRSLLPEQVKFFWDPEIQGKSFVTVNMS